MSQNQSEQEMTGLSDAVYVSTEQEITGLRCTPTYVSTEQEMAGFSDTVYVSTEQEITGLSVTAMSRQSRRWQASAMRSCLGGAGMTPRQTTCVVGPLAGVQPPGTSYRQTSHHTWHRERAAKAPTMSPAALLALLREAVTHCEAQAQCS